MHCVGKRSLATILILLEQSLLHVKISSTLSMLNFEFVFDSLTSRRFRIAHPKCKPKEVRSNANSLSHPGTRNIGRVYYCGLYGRVTMSD